MNEYKGILISVCVCLRFPGAASVILSSREDESEGESDEGESDEDESDEGESESDRARRHVTVQDAPW